MTRSYRMIRLAGAVAVAAWWTGPESWAQQRVADTSHNLSASGPGQIRALNEEQICVFCHATHNTSGMRPLWNRDESAASYQIYESSTLDAKPGQPTGSSKLCLSCHDGTIALGRVLSRSDRIRMTGGDFMPSGLTNLGSDLSDDHPVSFEYTSGLAASDRQLANPTGLRTEVRLDVAGRLQCTSCHNPHSNAYGSFLVTRQEHGELCTSCHVMEGWSSSAHAQSGATVSAAPDADWPFSTVAENACRSCHRPHTAGGRERLLIFEKEEDNCLNCHDGGVARTNIRAELNKTSAHDPSHRSQIHDPAEPLRGDPEHVECGDCHNPHSATEEIVATTYVPLGATLAKVRGVTSGGAEVDAARNEYEICFRCHAASAVQVSRRVSRQIQRTDLRLKFSSGNPSFHPVIVSSPSRDVVSLVPGLVPGTMIRCTDCHNNDSGPRSGGSGPDGPHGSIYDFLLERNYTTDDDTVESEYSYALCYKCHQRTSILGDRSFTAHRLHVVDERTPCSACHAPHGISATQRSGSDHTHLINFDLSIVRPDPVTQRTVFRDLGTHSGTCTLLCHGSAHEARPYGPDGSVVPELELPAAKRIRRR
ncbi:MAG: hypothetical protein GY842_22400 [bacterium]|nr:hypothetical protein [bacterium]